MTVCLSILLITHAIYKERQSKMKKKTISRVALGALALFMLLTILFTGGISSFGRSLTASNYLKEYAGNLKTNVDKYFNSSVVQKLPSTVKDTDTISVIFNLDTPAIMDGHKASGKGMSITEFAMSDEGKAIVTKIANERKEILSDLDAKGIKYQKGAAYTTIIGGFELLITAKDFDDACDVLGKRGSAIVGEVYNPSEAQLVENKVNFYENTGIFNSSDFEFDGTGMVVAVLDTGLDYTHSAFSVENFTSAKLGLTKDDVAALLLNKEFFC